MHQGCSDFGGEICGDEEALLQGAMAAPVRWSGLPRDVRDSAYVRLRKENNVWDSGTLEAIIRAKYLY